MRTGALLFLLVSAAAAGQAKDGGAPAPWKPGTVFIDHGACPGECCTYREWVALQPFDLLATPGGTRVVGRIAAKEPVTAETGEVHVAGAKATVVRERELESRPKGKKAKSKVKPGDVVWVLTPVGEGYSVVWIDGLFYQEATWFIGASGCSGRAAGPECWAKLDAPNKPPAFTWWVRLRTAKGVTGWARHEGQLAGSDACE